MRKLKHHERKLLKKVDFISWKADKNLVEIKILRQFHIQKREHYAKYCKLASEIHALVKSVLTLSTKDAFRIKTSAQILDKLYSMGVIPDKSR
jgi:U3 small nucleolar ribonucleoprotein protein IMP3